jgi:hypothetical protein
MEDHFAPTHEMIGNRAPQRTRHWLTTHTILKPLLLAVLLTTSLLAAANDPFIPPLRQIEQSGSICVGDGSSYFMFAKDGTFQSGPLGMSGRTMTGRWTHDDDGRFVVTAKLGWMNGIIPADQYRRIVFHIYYVTKRTNELKVPFLSSTEVSDSYFLIEEMTIIPKPERDFQK